MIARLICLIRGHKGNRLYQTFPEPQRGLIPVTFYFSSGRRAELRGCTRCGTVYADKPEKAT